MSLYVYRPHSLPTASYVPPTLPESVPLLLCLLSILRSPSLVFSLLLRARARFDDERFSSLLSMHVGPLPTKMLLLLLRNANINANVQLAAVLRPGPDRWMLFPLALSLSGFGSTGPSIPFGNALGLFVTVLPYAW